MNPKIGGTRNQRGLIFSAEAILGTALLIAALAGFAVFLQSTHSTVDTVLWNQTKIMLNTQTKFILGQPFLQYTGPKDYYCYSVQAQNIGIGENSFERQNCEELP